MDRTLAGSPPKECPPISTHLNYLEVGDCINIKYQNIPRDHNGNVFNFTQLFHIDFSKEMKNYKEYADRVEALMKIETDGRLAGDVEKYPELGIIPEIKKKAAEVYRMITDDESLRLVPEKYKSAYATFHQRQHTASQINALDIDVDRMKGAHTVDRIFISSSLRSVSEPEDGNLSWLSAVTTYLSKAWRPFEYVQGLQRKRDGLLLVLEEYSRYVSYRELLFECLVKQWTKRCADNYAKNHNQLQN